MDQYRMCAMESPLSRGESLFLYTVKLGYNVKQNLVKYYDLALKIFSYKELAYNKLGHNKQGYNEQCPI